MICRFHWTSTRCLLWWVWNTSLSSRMYIGTASLLLSSLWYGIIFPESDLIIWIDGQKNSNRGKFPRSPVLVWYQSQGPTPLIQGMCPHRTELCSGGPGFTTTMLSPPLFISASNTKQMVIRRWWLNSQLKNHTMLTKNLSSIVKRRHLHLHPHPSPLKREKRKNRSLRVVLSGLQNRLKDPYWGSDSGSDDDEVLPKPSPPSQSQPKLPERVTAPLTKVQVSNVENLKTFVVKPRNKGQKGILYYKSSPQPL